MKLRKSLWLGQTTSETIGLFGAAKLLEKSDGRYELVGGTADDHTAVLEWCSHFAPEIVFASRLLVSPPRHGIAFAA